MNKSISITVMEILMFLLRENDVSVCINFLDRQSVLALNTFLREYGNFYSGSYLINQVLDAINRKLSGM